MRALSRSRRRSATGALAAAGAGLAFAIVLAAPFGATRAGALAAQADPTTVAPPPTSAISGTITGSKTTVTPPPPTTVSPPVTAAPASAAAPVATARAQPASSVAAPPATARRAATVSTAASAPSTLPATVAAPTATAAPAASVAPTGATTTSATTVVATTVVPTAAAAKVGDPGATRTVKGIAWTLLAMAALLAGLTAWFWRLTRPLPPVLGGLAVMGTTRWRRAPRHVQDELVSAVRVDAPALGPGAVDEPRPAVHDADVDPDLSPIVAAPALDASFEWPPAASPEEIAALAPQYGWGRSGRPAVAAAAAPFLPASTNSSASAAGVVTGRDRDAVTPAMSTALAPPAAVAGPVPPPVATVGVGGATGAADSSSGGGPVTSPPARDVEVSPVRGERPVAGWAGDDAVPNLFADDPSTGPPGGEPMPAQPADVAASPPVVVAGPLQPGRLPPPMPAPRAAPEPTS